VACHFVSARRAHDHPTRFSAGISYIDTDEGWLYLAGIKDLFNKEIIGYAMGDMDNGESGWQCTVPGGTKQASDRRADPSFGVVNIAHAVIRPC